MDKKQELMKKAAESWFKNDTDYKNGLKTMSDLLEYNTLYNYVQKSNFNKIIGDLPTEQQNKGEVYMDEGYKRLIDRLDQDMRDHKKEISDRDARLQSDAAEREKRYHDEAKEREDRIMKTLERVENKLDGTIERMDSKIDKISDKIIETHRHTQIMSITVILGVAAMVVTAIVGIVWPTTHSATSTTSTNITSSK